MRNDSILTEQQLISLALIQLSFFMIEAVMFIQILAK